MNNKELYTKNCMEITKLEDETAVTAVRIKSPDGKEEVRVHLEENGAVVSRIDFPYSKMSSNIKQLSDGGHPVKSTEIRSIIRAVEQSYKNIPIIEEVNHLGWQKAKGGEITGYASAVLLSDKGEEQPLDIYSGVPFPNSAGTFSPDVFNRYMNGKPIRQAIFLHQLSAVILGLEGGENLMLVIVGKSSKGKTSIAKIAQSFFAEMGNKYLSLNLNRTINNTELELSGKDGVAVILDDTSLAQGEVNTKEIAYRLAEGKVKGRTVKRKDKFQVSDNLDFKTSILITAENSMFGNVDVTLEGINGRLTEIVIDNEKVLFDSPKQCEEMMKYCSENFGNVVPELVKAIMKEGIDNLCLEVQKEKSIISQQLRQEEVILRQARKYAIMKVTARLAKKALGLNFDIDAVIRLLDGACWECLGDVRQERRYDLALEETITEIMEVGALSKTRHRGKLYYFVESDTMQKILNKRKEKRSFRSMKMALADRGVLYSEGSEFSFNTAENRRGYLINMNYNVTACKEKVA